MAVHIGFLRMSKKDLQVLSRDFIDFSDLNKIENAITDKTKMIWVETPTNPLLKVIDLGTQFPDLIKDRDIIAVCDNTFCSPWVQKPLNHNFDSYAFYTKYIGGHSDVVAGIAVISKERSDLSAERT